MLTKYITVILLVLTAIAAALQTPWPAPSPAGAAMLRLGPTAPSDGRGTRPVPILPVSQIAIDDYRMNLQGGVTADAYTLAPLAEHDAARTQSMIHGIVFDRRWGWW
jgi:hypothetical protein